MTMKGAGGVLKATMQKSWEAICKAGRGVNMPAGGYSVRLPAEIVGRTDRILWDLLPQEPVPTSCRGLAEDEEQDVLNSMEEELLLKMDVKINVKGASNRSLRQRRPTKLRRLVVVGAINVSRLASCLLEAGHVVTKVETFNWKPEAEAVRELVASVEAVVMNTAPDGVIFQLLDNVLYMAKKLDGSTGHHVKGSDGVYHVPGELILAAKDVQYNVYNMIKPVLCHFSKLRGGNLLADGYPARRKSSFK